MSIAVDSVKRAVLRNAPESIIQTYRSVKISAIVGPDLPVLVHIPKNAGTTISMHLYGRPIPHLPSRCYPKRLQSRLFTVLREPAARFQSAVRFYASGGTARVKVVESDVYALEHALTTENRSLLSKLDFAFHSQAIYTSNVVPERIFTTDQISKLPQLVPNFPAWSKVTRENVSSTKLPSELYNSCPKIKSVLEDRDTARALAFHFYPEDFLFYDQYATG